MNTFDKFIAGAFALIAIYLLFNSQEATSVISGIASNTAGIFGTLQGRRVDFGSGVRVG